MNSTIIRKKRKLDCGCYDYAFSKNLCKAHATIKSTQKRVEKHEEQEESESIQNLISDLDFVFSHYIRNKYADDKGFVECYTCSKKAPIAEMSNGHYTSRSNYGLRFMEDNCRVQCYACNSKHETDITPFKIALEKEKQGITEWLETQARQVYKPTREELKQLLAEYRYKLNDVKKKFKK
ncbi:MAG: hypothetical protein B7Y37_13695 [Sphingobacteriia bacterium 28-36-52]|nr:MAG: hypothetical protein B7Y37_13695 [Sphingobacteriia bacterium 28-36-52]